MLKHFKIKEFKKKIAATLCLLFLANPLTVFGASIQARASKADTYAAGQNIVLKGAVSLAKGNQKIAVSLRDSDLKQVLRMFADKAGLNIVFHDSVQGKITLDLVNVSLNDAFNMIMEMAELSYTIENDTLLVASAEKSKDLNFTKQSMMSLPVKYANATDIAEFLNTNIFSTNRPGLSNTKIAITNTRDNEILIMGSKSDYLVAQKIIAKLDKPQRMITYKVNHTTPAEMATMLCDTFFSSDSTSDAGSAKPETKIASLKEKITNKFKGGITGAASSSSSSSSSSITLGGATVACTYSPDSSSSGGSGSDMISLKNGGTKVLYQTELGLIKLIGATQEQEQQIAAFIKETDKKQPQAYVEMTIVELNEEGSKEFQNTWSIYSNTFSGNVGGSGLKSFTSDTIRYPIAWTGGTQYWGSLTSPTPTSADLKWNRTPMVYQQISYLITNKKGRTLATPKIMVTNGKASTIDLSSDYVKTVKSQVLTSNGVQGTEQREYEIADDNGIKIELTPFISPDGYVSMNIKPDYATIKNQITAPNKAGTQDVVATLLQRRNIELTNVRIKDGETLLIGGLIQENENKTTSKTPILGDIPIIGLLFRNSYNGKSKSELVIMITPHIIKDSEDLVNTNENISL